MRKAGRKGGEEDEVSVDVQRGTFWGDELAVEVQSEVLCETQSDLVALKNEIRKEGFLPSNSIS